MKDRELFLSALEIEDPAARHTHLKNECGDDTTLLARVEALLASHESESQFLNRPVVEQITEPADAGSVATIRFGNGSAGDDEIDETTIHAPRRVGKAETQDDEDDGNPLEYLEPSTKPDSLGRLGHYEVLQIIGRGAFGTVLRAFDEKLHRVVAIKALAPEMAATSPARKRFIREAQASAAIRHEHVVSIYAVEEKPIPHLVMEYIPGVTLQQRLDERGPLAVSTVLRLGRQIAEALAAAHAQNLIHRDIKPGNILLETSAHDRVKITDFGLARAADDASLTQSGTITGTPMYMAPEQALGHQLDPRADLFSFGSVLYQMVSGQPPFRASSALAVLKRVVEEVPRPISEIIPETPLWLCNIITKLHAKNPDDRYPSAQDVAEVLADYEVQLKADSKLQDFSRIPAAHAVKSAKRNWLTAGGIGGMILLLGVILITITNKDGTKIKIEVSEANNVSHDAGKDVRVDISAVERTDTQPSTVNSQPIAPQPVETALPGSFSNTIGMEFMLVPKGKSWLGGRKDKPGDEEVEILTDFYLGKYEVTQEEWEKVMGENPSHFSRSGKGIDAVKDVNDEDLKRFPVEYVSWEKCQNFVTKLNDREQEPNWNYRLPTKLEWEYACRGGPQVDKVATAYDFYLSQPTSTLAIQQANIGGNRGLNRTCKVGSYEPNSLGLHDLHGNVFEWCLDPVARPEGAPWRATRSGCFKHGGDRCLAAASHSSPPPARYNDLGFRLARVPTGVPSPTAK